MRLEIRPARLEDAAGISWTHRGSVQTWFRYPAKGPPIPTSYEELDDLERWKNGGPWMVLSSCQAHLAWLLGGAGQAWVALLGGEIVGEAETFLNEEPPPLGRYHNLSVLYLHRRAQGQGIGRVFMQELLTAADEAACQAFLVGSVEPEACGFYARMGFSLWQTMCQTQVRCAPGELAGQPFLPGDYAQVAGLPMPVGRHQGAGQEWEQLRGATLVPGMPAPSRRDWRLLDIAGEPAWTAFAESIFHPDQAQVYAWSHARPEDLLPLLLAEADALGYRQADLLLAEPAFSQWKEQSHSVETSRHEAWWRQLRAAT